MYDFLHVSQPHLPFDAQFVCIRACHETASVSILGDASFGKKILARLARGAMQLKPGQMVEDNNTEQWDALRHPNTPSRVTYRHLRGVRVSALTPHASMPYPRQAPHYAMFRADGLFKADDTPIDAFVNGHLSFHDDYPGRALACCVDRTAWAWIGPSGLLEIYATPFALRRFDGDLRLGPARDGYLQVKHLQGLLYDHGGKTPLSAAELIETGQRTCWQAGCVSDHPVRLSIDGNVARATAHNWDGLARLVRLCDRALQQDVHGQASQAFGDRRLRFKLAPANGATAITCSPTNILVHLSHQALQTFRDAMLCSYGYVRSVACGHFVVEAIVPLPSHSE